MAERHELGGEFKTQDLYFAGALLTAGYPLVDILREGDNRRVAWVFRQDESLGEVISDYWGRRLKVDALTFAENLRNLKTQIFAVRR